MLFTFTQIGAKKKAFGNQIRNVLKSSYTGHINSSWTANLHYAEANLKSSDKFIKDSIMSRFRDNSGIPNTCPKIDEVISAIKSVDWGDDNYWDEKGLTEIMEKIRNANSELRDWGNEMNRERDDLQGLLDDLENENKKLKQDIESCIYEIKMLENKIESFEYEQKHFHKSPIGADA